MHLATMTHPWQYEYTTLELPVSLNIYEGPTVQLGFCYDSVINVGLLKQSLQRLIVDHWPILGGRLVKGEDVGASNA